MASARLIALDELRGGARGMLPAQLALPSAARAYLELRLPQLHLLLTGLTRAQVGVLRGRIDGADVVGVELFPHLLLGAGQPADLALLSGRLEQVERLVGALDDVELAEALRRALAAGVERPRWKIGEGLLPARTAVMGVINVTPDSFSDGGRFLAPGAAIAQGLRLVEEGADLLDVGGESTRPGGGTYGAGMREISAEEELARVLPVLRGLAQAGVPLSIDTRKLEVARAALDAGAQIINDVSGLTHAPGLAKLAAERKASLCVMHSKGELGSMQVAPRYDDLLGEVSQFLATAVRRAQEAGVEAERIAIDPGLGFGKTVAHNLALLHALPALAAGGFAVLVGASRKSFVGQATGVKAPGERLLGSVAAAVAAAMRGASVVRVHDVAATVEALKLADAVLAASP